MINTRENLRKYRAWDKTLKKFKYFSLKSLLIWCNNGIKVSVDWDMDEIQEYTGILDVNRREIYEGDILEETHYGESSVYKSALDFVLNNENKDEITYPYRGVVFRPTRLFPIMYCEKTFRNGYTDLPYFTFPLDTTSGQLNGNYIKENTKVIGNIYENVEMCRYGPNGPQCHSDKCDEPDTHYRWGNLKPENKTI